MAPQRTDRAIPDETLEWALAHLPPVVREVVLLKAQDGMTFRDISRITGLLLPTAASHYWRGIRKLRSLLENHHEH